MDLKDIKAIIDLMRKNSVSEFELEKQDFKIRLKRGVNGPVSSASYEETPALAYLSPAATTPVPAAAAPASAPARTTVSAPTAAVGGGAASPAVVPPDGAPAGAAPVATIPGAPSGATAPPVAVKGCLLGVCVNLGG